MFSNQSTELSLNTPTRSITSITGDKQQHRFLVGTCALPTTTPGSDVTPNQLHVLRYHEEMNELAIDAQLDHPTGEVWKCSSCPYDTTLVITCGGSGGGEGSSRSPTRTVLWRMPSEVLRDDDLDYEDVDHVTLDMGVGSSGALNMGVATGVSGAGGGGGGGIGGGAFLMEEVTSLNLRDDNATATSILSGRVTDMKWNPDLLLENSMGNNFNGDGDFGATCSAGCNFLTASYPYSNNVNNNPIVGIITAWDMATSSAIPIHTIAVPASKKSNHGSYSNRNIIAPKVAWDPHNTNLLAATSNTDVVLLDLRCNNYTNITNGIKACHRYGITDLDYNPNKPHLLSTCGHDGLVKFWDLRYTSSSNENDDYDDYSNNYEDVNRSERSISSNSTFTRQTPLKVLRGGHTHWTNSVKYNTFHDQLLLTGGCDGMVNLWRVSSISSAPLIDLGGGTSTSAGGAGEKATTSSVDDNSLMGSNDGFNMYHTDSYDGETTSVVDDIERKHKSNLDSATDDDVDESDGDRGRGREGGNAPDVRVSKFEMGEAVYDLTWSAADPWVYVCVGFDGNVVLNHVPSKEKYKILL